MIVIQLDSSAAPSISLSVNEFKFADVGLVSIIYNVCDYHAFIKLLVSLSYLHRLTDSIFISVNYLILQ